MKSSLDRNNKPKNKDTAAQKPLFESTEYAETFQAAEANMRNIFLQAPAFICILRGPNHVFNLANDMYMQLTGNREIIGKPIREALPELKGQGFYELLDNVYETGKSYVGNEMPVKLYRGNDILEEVYVNFVYQASYDVNGSIDGILVHGVDVTKGVLLREKIKESEIKYRDLIYGLPVAVYTCDADGYIELYNDAAVKLWGMPPCVGKDKWCGSGKIYKTDGTPIPLNECPMAIALTEGQIPDMEIMFERPDGNRRFVIANPQPIYDANKKITGTINTLIDITPQVEARQKKEQSEEQFNILVNNIQNLAWIADSDGYIFWYNKRWYEYTGTTPEEMEGWGWQSVHDPEKLPRVLERWKNSIDTGEPFEMIFPLKGADNIFRSFLTRVFPVLDKEGKVSRWIGTNTDIDEQKTFTEKLEQSFKESEVRMQTTLQYAPDAVITIDEDGLILSWNPQAQFIFGWKEEEVLGKTLTVSIIPERYRERHEMGMKHFLKTGEGPVMNKAIEISALKKDNTEFSVELKISATQMNGRFMFIGFLRDITARKHTDEALKNKTNQLVEAQQLAHIGSWEWDVTKEKVDWSDELYRIYGLVPQEIEITIEILFNFIHIDDREYVKGLIDQSSVDHQPINFFHRIVWNDGTVRILNATGKVFTDNTGKVIKMAGTAQDVTEQKKFEAELLKSEERFLKIFDNNPIPMTLAEIKTNVIKHANNHFYETFGFSREEVIGCTSDELNLISPEENERVTAIIIDSLKENRSLTELQALSADETEELLNKLKHNDIMKNLEVCYTRKNGATFPALVSYEIIKIGNERYTITSYQNITERKKAEEQLKEQNDKLEKMNKELESFAYVSSHDLQEPLRKIQTFASRILEKEYHNLSETGQRHFERMFDSAKRMQTLIEDLLNYSRTARETHELEKVNLAQILDEVKEELKEELQQKDAVIDADVMCEANIIPFQFRQLMHNIIGNSLKFSKPEIQPIIKIRSEITRGHDLKNSDLIPQRNYCHIEFTDNGIGFEPEYSEKIFEVFQRLHGKNQYNGTGIGLAIVKKIVENHNGKIIASGKLGQGAKFDVYIPSN